MLALELYGYYKNPGKNSKPSVIVIFLLASGGPETVRSWTTGQDCALKPSRQRPMMGTCSGVFLDSGGIPEGVDPKGLLAPNSLCLPPSLGLGQDATSPMARSGPDEGKKYQCSVCGKRFAAPSLVQRHFYVHTGEKPFVCSYCGRGFSQHANMKSHQVHCKCKEDISS